MQQCAASAHLVHSSCILALQCGGGIRSHDENGASFRELNSVNVGVCMKRIQRGKRLQMICVHSFLRREVCGARTTNIPDQRVMSWVTKSRNAAGNGRVGAQVTLRCFVAYYSKKKSVEKFRKKKAMYQDFNLVIRMIVPVRRRMHQP